MPNPLDDLREINREERNKLTKPMSKTSFTQNFIPSNDGSDVPTARLNVEIPVDLHSDLKQYCAKRRIPIRQFLTDLITDAIGDEGK